MIDALTFDRRFYIVWYLKNILEEKYATFLIALSLTYIGL